MQLVLCQLQQLHNLTNLFFWARKRSLCPLSLQFLYGICSSTLSHFYATLLTSPEIQRQLFEEEFKLKFVWGGKCLCLSPALLYWESVNDMLKILLPHRGLWSDFSLAPWSCKDLGLVFPPRAVTGDSQQAKRRPINSGACMLITAISETFVN